MIDFSRFRDERGEVKGQGTIIVLVIAAIIYWGVKFGPDLLDFQSVKKSVKECGTEAIQREGSVEIFHACLYNDLNRLGFKYLKPERDFQLYEIFDGQYKAQVEYKRTVVHPLVKKKTTKKFKFTCENEVGDRMCK